MVDQMKRIEREEQQAKERAQAQAAQAEEEDKQEQEELAAAIQFERRERAATIIKEMGEEPAAGPEVAEVVFRSQGTGKKFPRRFHK